MTVLELYAIKEQDGGATIYRDKAATNIACHFPPWRSDCPTRRNRWLMLNCYKWRLVWL